MASPHNSIIFKHPQNFPGSNGLSRVTVRGTSTRVSQMTDNDYETYSTRGDVDMAVGDSGTATRVNAVFLKSIGVTSYSATPTGGTGAGFTNRAIPATVSNFNGTSIRTTINGFQHDLHLLDTGFTATSVRMQFSGAGFRIYTVMLLEVALEIDVNAKETVTLELDYVDRAGRVETGTRANIEHGLGLGGGRRKWEANYAIKVVPGQTTNDSVSTLVQQLSDNANGALAIEPSRYPDLVFPATLLSDRIEARYRSDYKGSGQQVSFQLGEQ